MFLKFPGRFSEIADGMYEKVPLDFLKLGLQIESFDEFLDEFFSQRMSEGITARIQKKSMELFMKQSL